MAQNLANFNSALKELYPDTIVQKMAYSKGGAFMSLVSKDYNFDGKKAIVPIVTAFSSGHSASFSQAQARAASTASQVKAFEITRANQYGVAIVEGEVLEASKKDTGAFLSAIKLEIDGAVHNVSRSVAINLFRSGFGSRGTVGASGGSTITLANKSEITNFEVGQEIVFSESESSHALRDSGDSLIISKIDRSNGVITFTSAVSNISGLSDGDHLFVKGDRQDSPTPSRLVTVGLEGWLPLVAPTAGDNFFGVDRSVDPSRLAGQRIDGSQMPLEEALIEAAALTAREGGTPDYCYMSYKKFSELVKALGSKVDYVDVKTAANIGFRGIKLLSDVGDITVLPDLNCKDDRAFMLQLDTWKLHSLGQTVRIQEDDGNSMLRRSSEDAVEVRIVHRGNLACTAPGYNAVIKLA